MTKFQKTNPCFGILFYANIGGKIIFKCDLYKKISKKNSMAERCWTGHVKKREKHTTVISYGPLSYYLNVLLIYHFEVIWKCHPY